ncbi:MAG: glutathione S-transferase family protein [Rhizobiaceae bacterium]
MLTIYAIPISLYCAKLRILLRHKKVAWKEIPPPGGYGSAEYKSIIPSGNLPALDEDGLLIGDSEAIAEYLNEKYPDPAMLPGDIAERAAIRELSRFHDTRLEPEVRKLFPLIDPEKRDVEIVAAQSAAISERLVQFGQLIIQKHLDNNRGLMLGDCGYPPTFTWLDTLTRILEFKLEWPEPVRSYRDRISKIEAVRDELASYQPFLHNWLKQRLSP